MGDRRHGSCMSAVDRLEVRGRGQAMPLRGLRLIVGCTLGFLMVGGPFLWPLRAQEVRAEERVAPSLDNEKDVLVAEERLRQLRLTESKLGERHPALKSIRKQIAELEEALDGRRERELLQAEGMDAGEEGGVADGGGAFGSLPNRLDLGLKSAETERSVSSAIAWSRALRLSWGEKLKSSAVWTGEPYRLVEAYPNIRFKNLEQMGPFPASGLMWGIENSSGDDYGCLWQWGDDPRSVNRVAMLEVSQRITGVVFTENFLDRGEMYVATASRDPGNGVRRLEVWRYRMQTLPPFSLVSKEGELVASGTTPSAQVGNLHGLPGGGLVLELGSGSSLTGAEGGATTAEIRTGIWRVSLAGREARNSVGPGDNELEMPGQGGAGIETEVGMSEAGLDRSGRHESYWVIDVKGDEVLAKDWMGVRENVRLAEWVVNRKVIGGFVRSQGTVQSSPIDLPGWIVVDGSSGEVIRSTGLEGTLGGGEVIARTSRKLERLGMDQHGMPLPIDEDGVVLRLELQPRVSKSLKMPTTLSESGWYVSVSEGRLEDAFAPVVVGGTKLGEGLRNDVWVCVPEGNRIDISQQEDWFYPDGTLILQTIRTEGEGSGQAMRLETHVLLRSQQTWYPSRYVWDALQQDAVLVKEDDGGSVAANSSVGGVAGNARLDHVRCNECHLDQGRRFLIGFESHCLVQEEGTQDEQRIVPSLRQRGVIGSGGNVAIGGEQGPGAMRRETFLAEAFERLGGEASDSVRLDVSPFGSEMATEHLRLWLVGASRSNGCFFTSLDEAWKPVSGAPESLTTQSQMLSCLAKGFEMTRDRAYEDTLLQGGEFLLKHYRDSRDGGYFWSVDREGKLVDSRKSLRGNAHAISGMLAVGRSTGRREYIKAASRCWEDLRVRMKHPAGGYYASATHNFDRLEGCSSASLMELYQALLELVEETGSDSVARDAEGLLEFVLGRLKQDGGYIPDRFEASWVAPKVIDRALEIELGDQLKWAFLISEGVRLGRTREPLKHGHALLDFAMSQGLDDSKGGIGQYENRWMKGTWQQAEFMRAMLRYADMHGRQNLLPTIEKTKEYIARSCVDAVHGGWVTTVGEGVAGNRRIPIAEVEMHLEADRIGNQPLGRRREGR
jgi:cellobiose epimerase